MMKPDQKLWHKQMMTSVTKRKWKRKRERNEILKQTSHKQGEEITSFFINKEKKLFSFCFFLSFSLSSASAFLSLSLSLSLKVSLWFSLKCLSHLLPCLFVDLNLSHFHHSQSSFFHFPSLSLSLSLLSLSLSLSLFSHFCLNSKEKRKCLTLWITKSNFVVFSAF